MSTREQIEAGVRDFSDLDFLAALAAGETPDDQTLEDYGLDADADFYDALECVALEVYGLEHHYPDSSRHGLTDIVIVTGTGGPHFEYRIDAQGLATHYGYWGSDTAQWSQYGENTYRAVYDLLAPVVSCQ